MPSKQAGREFYEVYGRLENTLSHLDRVLEALRNLQCDPDDPRIDEILLYAKLARDFLEDSRVRLFGAQP